MITPELLNAKQAAKILGISDSMVRRLLRTGQLNGYKMNERSWAVYQDEKFNFLTHKKMETINYELSL